MKLSYVVRNVKVDPGLVLAPMSGVTTSALRCLIKEYNPGAVGLVMSEFISVEALTRKVPRALKMLRYKEIERPVALQIFGYDVDRMRDGALMCQDAGADIVDINCGCPAPKVVRKGGGAELMRQPEQLTKILREVRRVLTVPLTIKIRAGWDQETRNALDIARMAESEGVDALAVHGRTRAQMYRGDADWNLVAQVKAGVSIPVSGSGDVTDEASAQQRLESGVDGLYIGRGVLANPFIFSELTSGSRHEAHGHPIKTVALIERYMDLLLEEFPAHAVLGRIKQIGSRMCRGMLWRKPLLLAQTLEAQREILSNVRQQVR